MHAVHLLSTPTVTKSVSNIASLSVDIVALARIASADMANSLVVAW